MFLIGAEVDGMDLTVTHAHLGRDAVSLYGRKYFIINSSYVVYLRR